MSAGMQPKSTSPDLNQLALLSADSSNKNRASGSQRRSHTNKSSSPSRNQFANELNRTDTPPKKKPAVSRAKPQNSATQKPDHPETRRGEEASAATSETQARKKRSIAEALQARRSARNALQPLKKAAVNNKKAVAETPVVALLTGDLAKLNPAQIPQLISANEFVKEALSEQNILDYINKPARVSDVLDSLDLPETLVFEAENQGLDLNGVASPHELLKAIGVDPQRVFAELKLLKDNLQFEGIAPYMQRAAAIRGSRDPLARELFAENKMDPSPKWINHRAQAIDAPHSPLEIRMNQMNQMGLQQESLANQRQTDPTYAGQVSNFDSIPQNEIMTVQNHFQGIPLEQTYGHQLLSVNLPDGNVDQKVSSTKTETVKPVVENIAAFDKLRDISSPSSAGLRLENQIRPTVAADSQLQELTFGKPLAKPATYDAYAALGERMPPVTADVTSRTAESTNLSKPNTEMVGIEEQLLRQRIVGGQSKAPTNDGTGRQSASLPFSINSEAASIINKISGQSLKNDPATLSKTLPAIPADASDLEPELIQANRLENINVVQKSIGKPAQLNSRLVQGERLSVEDLTGHLIMPKKEDGEITRFANAEQKLGDDSGASQHESSMQSIAHLSFSSPAKMGATNGGRFDLEVGMTLKQRVEVVQQILDRASMIARDGGGTMRLDFNGHGLGQLEMAVNVVNDRVDLRILTSSDRVRNLLHGEINELRHSLSTQNLQLGQVEVGVSGKENGGGNADLFAGHGFSGEGFREMAQEDNTFEFENAFEDADQNLKEVGEKVQQRILPHMLPQQLQTTNGRIQIRV